MRAYWWIGVLAHRRWAQKRWTLSTPTRNGQLGRRYLSFGGIEIEETRKATKCKKTENRLRFRSLNEGSPCAVAEPIVFPPYHMELQSRYPEFIWAPCAQLYSLAETSQRPPPPEFGPIYEGAIGQPIEKTSLLWPPAQISFQRRKTAILDKLCFFFISPG